MNDEERRKIKRNDLTYRTRPITSYRWNDSGSFTMISLKRIKTCVHFKWLGNSWFALIEKKEGQGRWPTIREIYKGIRRE